MDAFHTNWTAPFLSRNPGSTYCVEPFELLTTMLSALQWQAIGNHITMITDDVGAAYYHALGLEKLWDGGIQPSLTDAVPKEISPNMFWAGGKLFALQQMPAPCVMLDTDFIVWQDIKPLCKDAEIAVIHLEEISPNIYPDKAHFQHTKGFDMDSLDWTVHPCNTALCYFRDEQQKQGYTDLAIDFMLHTVEGGDPLTYMVFAEQRLLAMYTNRIHARLISFFDLKELFCDGQKYFTHVWGFKQQMREQPAAYDIFCRRCAARLSRDFPIFAEISRQIPSLKPYFS